MIFMFRQVGFYFFNNIFAVKNVIFCNNLAQINLPMYNHNTDFPTPQRSPYSTPSVEILKVRVELGFAQTSGDVFGDPGDLTPGENPGWDD